MVSTLWFHCLLHCNHSVSDQFRPPPVGAYLDALPVILLPAVAIVAQYAGEGCEEVEVNQNQSQLGADSARSGLEMIHGLDPRPWPTAPLQLCLIEHSALCFSGFGIDIVSPPNLLPFLTHPPEYLSDLQRGGKHPTVQRQPNLILTGECQQISI